MSYLKIELRARRQKRLRYKLRIRSGNRPRLSVFRSGKHIYAQIIDDLIGRTVVSASSIDKAFRMTSSAGSDKDAASRVGRLLAQRALAVGIVAVAFDRGSYLYHGRVKALAEAAREVGMSF